MLGDDEVSESKLKTETDGGDIVGFCLGLSFLELEAIVVWNV